MVNKYSLKYNGDIKLSTHFAVKEFASKNGVIVYTDDVFIDTDIIEILEKLFDYMSAYKIIITSGYRNATHEKAVGNKSGKGYHTTGQAVDINVWKSANERYTQSEIALALEELNWNGGIGLINSNTAIHIDNRGSKYYFNERLGNIKINSEQSFHKLYNKENKVLKCKKKFDLSDYTINYILEYKYASNLIEKLNKRVKKVTNGTLASNVKDMYDLAEETIEYLCKYEYNDDLLEKLFIRSENE